MNTTPCYNRFARTLQFETMSAKEMAQTPHTELSYGERVAVGGVPWVWVGDCLGGLWMREIPTER